MSDFQKEFMVMAASMMPKEQIIEQLKDSITQYEISPSEENERNVLMHCTLLMTKHAADSTEGGAISLIQKMKEHDQREKLFDTNHN